MKLLILFRTEFMRNNSSRLWRIERGCDDIKGYTAMIDHTKSVSLWMVGKSA
jgi:hypothetical protein